MAGHVTSGSANAILSFDQDAAQVSGRPPRAAYPENPLDKQIAATALIYDLIGVTRNVAHCEPTGVRLHPFD
jgi:predicted nucleic acid-binding protein